MEWCSPHQYKRFCPLCTTELVDISKGTHAFSCCECGSGPQLRDINPACCECEHRHDRRATEAVCPPKFSGLGLVNTTKLHRRKYQTIPCQAIHSPTDFTVKPCDLVHSRSETGSSTSTFTNTTSSIETSSTFTVTESDHSDDQYWEIESDDTCSTYSNSAESFSQKKVVLPIGLLSIQDTDSVRYTSVLEKIIASVVNYPAEGGSSTGSTTERSQTETSSSSASVGISLKRSKPGSGRNTFDKNDDDKDDDRGPKRRQKIKASEKAVRKLACPYFRRYPLDHYECCKGVKGGWPSIPRLK
jgi:hypothetical protein